MVRVPFFAAAAFAALASLTPAHAATLIGDGNFDAPLSPGNFTTYSSGQSFGPWTVGSGSVDLIGNYWQAPATGGGSVDLNGGDAGSIYQFFNATPGRYQVSFYLSGNPDGGSNLKNMFADVSGIDLHSYTFDTTGLSKTNMGYVLETFQFVSTGGSQYLQFASTDAGTPYGAVIGGVEVSAVPEASTWAMLLLGFGGIGMMLRARGRKQVALSA
jgi:choice-of-anchor C domain-containing protein